MQNPEQILVERLRSKDKRAFELVFNEYYGLLKSYAMRFIEEAEDAEEVVQDVFVKFWERCDTISSDSSVRNYLYRSVHNSCLNYIKHQKVKDAYRLHVIAMMEETADDVAQEEEGVRERIMDEINNLPPRCSEIFKLSRFDGLKYQEIADHLQISIKTVEVQVGKALKLLREKLKDVKA